MGAPKRDVHVQTPGTCASGLIWKKDLCRCGSVKNLKVRSSRIMCVALHPMAASVPEAEGEETMGEGGPVKTEVETGMTGPQAKVARSRQELEGSRRDLLLEPLGKCSPADPWILDSWPPEQQVSVALSPRSVVLWCGGPRTLTHLPYPCRGVCGTLSRCQVAASYPGKPLARCWRRPACSAGGGGGTPCGLAAGALGLCVISAPLSASPVDTRPPCVGFLSD